MVTHLSLPRLTNDLNPDRHAVAQQAIDRPVVVVQAPVRVFRLRLESMARAGDLGRLVAASLQKRRQQLLVDFCCCRADLPSTRGSDSPALPERA